ncbi:MAG: outer membrane protein assembly factor BamD [Bdellovibrionales bacterium]
MADLNYKREAYGEAQIAYQIYKEFYPRDSISDYVTYRIGMSFFKQLPEKIGRDLSVAEDAVRYFDELLDLYPTSSYVEDAKKNKAKALKLLAEKELYVADFYMKQETYSSALGRFEDVLKNIQILVLIKGHCLELWSARIEMIINVKHNSI